MKLTLSNSKTNALDFFNGGQEDAPAPVSVVSSLLLPKQIDNSWRAHRTIKAGMASENLYWELPITSKEKDAGKSAVTEIIPRKTKFVAARGIYIRHAFGFGFSKEENTPKGKQWSTICQTTKMVTPMSDGSKKVKADNLPMDFVVRQPHKSKADPLALSSILETLEQNGVELYGSRPPVGQPDLKGSFRTCFDCVRSGEYAEDITNLKAGKCSARGEMLFCVFALAEIDDDNYDPLASGPIPVIWKSVEDCGLVTINGEERTPLNRPFILRLTGIGASQLSNIGTGPYDRNVVMPPKSTYLPEDAMSFGQLWNKLHDQTNPRYLSLRSKDQIEAVGHNMVYPVMVEMYSGQLVDPQFGQNYIPVFKINEDEEVLGDLSIQEYVMQAVVTMQHEKALADGQQLNVIEDDGADSSPSHQTISPKSTSNVSSIVEEAKGDTDDAPTPMVDIKPEEVPAGEEDEPTGDLSATVRRRPVSSSFSPFQRKKKAEAAEGPVETAEVSE